MFENPRRGRQAKNFTTNAPKILDLKSSSKQIFFRKVSLGAPDSLEQRIRYIRYMDFWGYWTIILLYKLIKHRIFSNLFTFRSVDFISITLSLQQKWAKTGNNRLTEKHKLLLCLLNDTSLKWCSHLKILAFLVLHCSICQTQQYG